MFSRHLFFILFYLKYASCIQRKLCLNDEECLINALIQRVYPKFVAGMPGVETSDPLHLDAIIADLPTVRYALFNATMTGLRDCEFVQVENKRQGLYTLFDYAISCATLTVYGEYALNGIINEIPVEGKGSCKIIYEDYHISIRGKHEKVKDDKGKLHVHIIDCIVTPVLQGGVKDPEYKNLVFSNDGSCENRVTALEEMTRDVVMDVFMNKYVQNLKSFHQNVPIEDLHFKYVR